MNPFLAAYCERAGLAGLLAEPLNAITNVAFLVAAVLVWRRLTSDPDLSPARQWDIALLAGVVFTIGLGSAAWHVSPIRLTLLADVIPISVFIHAYLVAFAIRVLGLSWPWALLLLGGYAVASVAAPSLLSLGDLRGTAAYLPAWAMLAIMCVVLAVTGNRHGQTLALILAVWTVSLLLRSVDGVACAWLPTGTHFLWHLLNAGVLYGLLGVLVSAARGNDSRPRRAARGARQE